MELYQGKKALVIGLGKSGCSAALFLLLRGASVIAVDDNLSKIKENDQIMTLIESGLHVEQDISLEELVSVDFIVCSPGVSPLHPLIQHGIKNGIEVIGEVELACRSLKSYCIGVTGTNGKTTLTLMLEHILSACGKRVKAVGNVGTPITSQIYNVDYDALIIELSSYQLETMSSRVLDCAVLMNITPDHLDRYISMQSYIAAKFRIFNLLKEDGVCIVHEDILNLSPSLIEDRKIQIYGKNPIHPLHFKDERFFFLGTSSQKWDHSFSEYGIHDLENILAAYGVCKRLNITDSQFFEALTTFNKPPHRIEFVGKIDGVLYYNDSKGTNVDAVMKAVASMRGEVVLIAGGVDKGSSFTTWLQSFPKKVKYICVIGEASKKIERELADTIPVELCGDLEVAVRRAAMVSVEGDHVLLSPGCASFDMFTNYEHRGDEFKRIVRNRLFS